MKNLLILLSMFFLVALGCNKEKPVEPKEEEEKGLFVLNDKQIKVDGIVYNRYNPDVAKQDTGLYVDTKGEFYVFLPYCKDAGINWRIVTKPFSNNLKDYLPFITILKKYPGGEEQYFEHTNSNHSFLMNWNESSYITVDYKNVKNNLIKKDSAKQYFTINIKRISSEYWMALVPIKYIIKLSGEELTKIHVKVIKNVDITNMKGRNYDKSKW